MYKDSILLYKTARGFSRFIKGSYLENFNIHYCNKSNMYESKHKRYAVAFISIEDTEDLISFASIYSNSDKVFIVSNFPVYNEMIIKLFNDVVILNSDMLRKDVIKIIENNLKSIKVSKNLID